MCSLFLSFSLLCDIYRGRSIIRLLYQYKMFCLLVSSVLAEGPAACEHVWGYTQRRSGKDSGETSAPLGDNMIPAWAAPLTSPYLTHKCTDRVAFAAAVSWLSLPGLGADGCGNRTLGLTEATCVFSKSEKRAKIGIPFRWHRCSSELSKAECLILENYIFLRSFDMCVLVTDVRPDKRLTERRRDPVMTTKGGKKTSAQKNNVRFAKSDIDLSRRPN